MNSLRNKILLIFTLFALVAISTISLSSRSTRAVGRIAENMADHHVPMVHALSGMQRAIINQDAAVYHFIATNNKKWKDQFEKSKEDYNRCIVEAKSKSDNADEQDELQAIDDLYWQYENVARKTLLTVSKNREASVKDLEAQSDDFLRDIKNSIAHLEAVRQGMTIARQDQVRETLERHHRIGFYFLMIIAVFFFLLAFYLVQYLVKPLSLLQEGIRNFTRGRLDIQIPPIGKDELGELQEAFNEMARELSGERKRLKNESQSDSLTGLFNMRYFRNQLADEFSRTQRYSHTVTLLMIDVDFFKDYNDRNGHPAGDIVLKEVSRLLVRNVRGTDIVARYGGEEFVVLLPETAAEAGIKVADKIRQAVETHHFPFQENANVSKLTVSVGVASYPDPEITSDQDLIEASDKALYHAKKNGRNQLAVFSQLERNSFKTRGKKGSEYSPLEKLG